MIEFFACCKGVLIKGRAFHAPIAPILTSAPMSRRGRGEVLGAPYYYRRGNAVWQWWHGVALGAQEAKPRVQWPSAACRDVLYRGAVFPVLCRPLLAYGTVLSHQIDPGSLHRHRVASVIQRAHSCCSHSCVHLLIPTYHAHHCASHVVSSPVIPVSLTLYLVSSTSICFCRYHGCSIDCFIDYFISYISINHGSWEHGNRSCGYLWADLCQDPIWQDNHHRRGRFGILRRRCEAGGF